MRVKSYYFQINWPHPSNYFVWNIANTERSRCQHRGALVPYTEVHDLPKHEAISSRGSAKKQKSDPRKRKPSGQCKCLRAVHIQKCKCRAKKEIAPSELKGTSSKSRCLLCDWPRMLVSNLGKGNNVSLSQMLSSNHLAEDAHHRYLGFWIRRANCCDTTL